MVTLFNMNSIDTGWKGPFKRCISFIRDIFAMGALKKTAYAFSRILTSYDGDTIRYSESNRHEKLMRKIESGPERDMLNFYKDLSSAMSTWKTNRSLKK